jgi:mono/diheme cytochrome c family protein
MRRSGLLVPLTMVVALVASAAVVRAASGDDLAIAQGKVLYDEYCASCHGADGRGGGPEAARLDKSVGDLTLLAKQNGGKFPFYDVMLTISNRPPTGQDQDASLPGTVTSHADGKMPAWGQLFARQEGSKGTSLDLQLQTTGKIMLITEYLQSIQAK